MHKSELSSRPALLGALLQSPALVQYSAAAARADSVMQLLPGHAPTTTALLMAWPIALSTTELWPFSSSRATA